MSESCTNCKFWQPWPERNGQPSKCGDCYGEPPTPSFTRGERPVRPWTFQDDICRYYINGTPRPPRQAKPQQQQGGGDYGTKDEIPF